jgi:quinolinate synthase
MHNFGVKIHVLSNDMPFYDYLSDRECEEIIVAAKTKLGSTLAILGHHYQREEVFRHADFTGDSLKLSREAAQAKARYIVFCGVHFMAEVADILSRPEQAVILPDLSAGCSMADMANLAKVLRAWEDLNRVLDAERSITPITYINSAADLKAFCGRHDGIVCTSSNAGKVLDWALARKANVLFFPDEHLGRYSAHRMGIPVSDMAVWNPDKPMGGLTADVIEKARVFLWQGFCSVHQIFNKQHIDRFRQQHPEGKVIAHPECSFEVCQSADEVGSTEYIIQTIADSPKGATWLVGTELNLVMRLARRFATEGKTIRFMAPMVCQCSTMARIDPQHLAWCLEQLTAGAVVNRIQVTQADKQDARIALERMLAL